MTGVKGQSGGEKSNFPQDFSRIDSKEFTMDAYENHLDKRFITKSMSELASCKKTLKKRGGKSSTVKDGASQIHSLQIQN